MKCSIKGCSGEYEEQDIFHTVRYKGKITVIDHVPAEVCSVCGDVFFNPETVRHIEGVLKKAYKPVSTAPLYEYA